VGAYFYALLASPQFGLHLPFWLLLPLGAAVACAFGVLLGAPTLRLRGDYLAIVTLGSGRFIRIFSEQPERAGQHHERAAGINLIDPIRVGGFSLAQTHTALGIPFPSVYNYYYLFLVLTLAVVFVSMRLENSRIGRAWVAIREDEVAAAAMGSTRAT
jgi:branched-chain amino acid transport system permease protein